MSKLNKKQFRLSDDDYWFMRRTLYLSDNQQRILFLYKISKDKDKQLIRPMVVSITVFILTIILGILFHNAPMAKSQHTLLDNIFIILGIVGGFVAPFFIAFRIAKGPANIENLYSMYDMADDSLANLKCIKADASDGIITPFDFTKAMYQFAVLCQKEDKANRLISSATKLQKSADYLNDWQRMNNLPNSDVRQIKDIYLQHLSDLNWQLYALIKDDLSNIHQRAIDLKIGGALSDDEKDKLNLTDGQKIIEDIK